VPRVTGHGRDRAPLLDRIDLVDLIVIRVNEVNKVNPVLATVKEIDMILFSSDVDILKYEPVLFGELHLPSQVLAGGTGAGLSGTALTAAGADFITAGIEPGGVIHLRSADGTLNGDCEIVSIDSATELTVSVVRADAADPAVAPPAGSDLTYRVSTFKPQAAEVALELTAYFGLRPGDPAGMLGVEDLLDTEPLRRVAVLGVLWRVYANWSGGPDEMAFANKSLFYGGLFEKARQRCRLTVDLGADGVAQVTRVGSAIRLIRA
jgi:hypothetical protein